MQLEKNQAEILESAVVGCSLSIHWWGINRKADVQVVSAVAESLGTNSKFLKLEKKLINPKNLYYRGLCEIRSAIGSAWRNYTLPYVEPGTRLIRKDLVDAFDQRMTAFKTELSEKISALCDNYELLKSEGKRALGELYRETDYPNNLQHLFGFSWEFPNLNPPEYLLMYNPKLYERQQELVRAKFEEAVQKAEKAFGGELQNMVSSLAERMQPNEDGSRKTFRDSTVSENFKEFFKRFKSISVTNSKDLADIVSMAEGVISGVNTEYLKTDGLARQDLANKMEEIGKLLESKIGVQPRRKLIRQTAEAMPVTESEHGS